MTLKGLELSALLSAGIMMSNADGKVTDEEKEILVKELKSFNVSDEEARLYLKVAFDMSTDYTVQVLKGMTSEKKKIGNNCTKAENSRSLKYLKDLGITF